jgi:carbon storage regulator
MLVFTRKSGQSLMIGDEIEIKILSFGSDSVRVGITAPRRIPVHRQEVYEAIKSQNEKAVKSILPDSGLLSRLKRISAKR